MTGSKKKKKGKEIPKNVSRNTTFKIKTEAETFLSIETEKKNKTKKNTLS